MFLLKIAWSLLDFGKVLIYQIQKSFSYVDRNIFVKRWIEPNDITGAISLLNYVLFICINWTNVVVTTSFRAFSYSPIDMSKTCLFEELFDKLLLIDVGSCYTICGGRFHEVLTCSSWSFGFLHCLYVSSNKSNVKSKKSTICKCFYFCFKTSVLKGFYYVFSY